MTNTRRWLSIGPGLVVLVGVVGYAVLRGAPAAAGDERSKVEPLVLEEIAKKGKTTFFVVLSEKPNLAPAAGFASRAQRTAFVYQKLKATAEASQGGLRRLLASRGVAHAPFWVLNAIKVTADESLLLELARRSEVERVIADRTMELPTTQPASAQATVNGVEWGIANIRAPEVWSASGVRGEGIVVAGIDTGVQFDHPALVRQYRGNLGGGRFDHNYNWHDPTGLCGPAPCDLNWHGTHITGTMVGDDGGTNKIGVAPRAQWVACNGCLRCSFSDLLSCGQWVVAPTDLSGQNPRPDLAPHVVNNSWNHFAVGNTAYQPVIDNWVAAGIFPIFSAANEGPRCFTTRSPGDFLNTYSVGAYDIENTIAEFSSRGPGAYKGEIKPNISAPGVAVRSSIPIRYSGSSVQYLARGGTSMAAPHVAGAVALLWSAAPWLEGKIAETRAVLDRSAINMPSTACGGTDADNNTWGEGRIDVAAAVQAAPAGRATILSGTAADGNMRQPLPGTVVRAVGPVDRSAVSDATGAYRLVLPPGTYTLTATRFGYRSETRTGVIVPEGGRTEDFVVRAARTFTVSGVVRDRAGAPVPGVPVSLFATPVPVARTDAKGAYALAGVPAGTYTVQVDPARCLVPQKAPLVVDGDEAVDFTLSQLSDGFGYVCEVAPFAFIEADTVLPLTGVQAAVQVTLPFAFTFYGQTHTSVSVVTNGYLDFQGSPPSFGGSPIPDPAAPNAGIYPYWQPLAVDAEASVRTRVLGTAPNRQFVVEWRNVAFGLVFDPTIRRVRFEVVLFEDGRILFQYADLEDVELGDFPVVGIENQAGTVALQYSHRRRSLENNSAILFRAP